jgi:hypothetical protein
VIFIDINGFSMMKDLLAPKYSLEYLGASKSALMIYDCQNAYK